MAKLSFSEWAEKNESTYSPKATTVSEKSSTASSPTSPKSTTKNTTGKLSFEDWLKERGIKSRASDVTETQFQTEAPTRASAVSIDSINSYLDKVNKYRANANHRLNTMSYKTAQQYYDTNAAELEELRKSADAIDEYFQINGNALGISDYEGLLSNLKDIRGMYDEYQTGYDSAREYHNKWSPTGLGISAGAFGAVNDAYDLKESISSTGGTNEDWYAEMQRKNEEAKAAEEEAWQAYRKAQSMNAFGKWDENGYAGSNEDAISAERGAWQAAKENRAYYDYALKLAEQQRYDNIDAGEKGRQEAYAGQQAFKAWQAEDKKEQAENAANNHRTAALMAPDNLGGAMFTQAVAAMSADQSWWQPNKDWTVDEERQFYVLFNRDMEEAKAYGEQVNNYHNAKQAYDKQQKTEEWATKNVFTGAVATAGALVGGATSLADFTANAVEYAARGTVTQKSYLTPADYSNIWTAAIASNLNEKDSAFNDVLAKLNPIVGEFGAGDVYQMGYNTLQSLTYGKILGPGAGAAAYFGIGAKSGYEDAAARGASPAKAFLMGVTTGGIEYLTEKYSIDNLLSIKSPVTLGKAIKSALVQGGIEATEEELSLIGNTLVDGLLMGDQSALKTAENEYILKGYSPSDAKKMAAKDWWREAAYTALSSAASGSISGGIQAIGQNVTRYKGDSQEIIDRAKMAPEGSETRLTAEEYQKILDRLNAPKEEKAPRESKAPKAKENAGKRFSLTPSAEFAQQHNANTEGGGFVSGKAKEQTNTREQQKPKTKGLTNAQAAHLTELSDASEIKSRLKAAGIENEKAEKAIVKLVSGMEVSRSDYKAIIATEGALDIAENIQADRMNGIKWNYPERGQSGSTVTTSANPKAINKNAAVEVNGERETIEAINYEGNKLRIKTASGWHSAANLNLPSEVQRIIRAFSPYKDSAAAMFRMYEPGQDPVKFAEAWAAAENMYGANTNADFTKARQAFNPADLTDGQLYIAFNKGRDRKNAAEAKAAQQSTQQSYTERTGVVSYDGGMVDGVQYKAVNKSKLTKAQKRQIAVVEKLAKALKINFVLYESELVNGRYTGASGIYTANTVYLDINAGLMRAGDKYGFGKVAILRTAAHELTHYLQANNLEGYNKLKDFLLTHISEYKGKNINDLVLQKQERAERAGSPISADEAMDEIVADGCEMMLKDSGLISKLANEDRSLAEQIKEWFANFSAEIEKAFAGIREEHEEARAMAEYAKELQQLWEDELIKAAKSGNVSRENKTNYAFRGYAQDGRGMYESNFPIGTPKKAKGARILRYIQDVWSKKPIKLKIEDTAGIRYIMAQFDPTYDETKNVFTDATKLMGGNRHGTASEQRVTLDLADDYYQIAAEARYNYSKNEEGKTTATHEDVKQWHYFINDIYFAEYGSDEYIPYRVTINVKEKAEGEFVYSFSAEKEESSSPRTLHAVVNSNETVAAKGTLFNDRIPSTGTDVKSQKSTDRYENHDISYQARDILPDERDLLMAEAAKRGASRDLKRYRAKYREVERLRARLTDLEDRQRADGEDLSEEISKTEASAERAENKLRELEASAPIQSAMESALAEWRSSNDAAAARVLRQLNEENERLRERVEYYKEEMQLSEDGRQRADASDIRAMANDIIKEYGSKVDRKYLAEQLQELADYIVSNGRGEGLDSHDIVRASRKIAANLVDNIYIRESSNEDAYNELRSYLQGVPLKISDELRSEAPEGIRRLRNQYYGRLRLEKEGMAIDSAYMELQEMFGEGLFPNDITAHLDQIEHIGEVLDELAPREVNPLSKTERLELGAFLADSIVDELLSDRVRQRSTLADRRLAQAVSRAQILNEELERVKYEEVNKRKELVQAKVTELRDKSIERDKAYKTTKRIKQKVNRLYKALKENSGKNHIPQEFKESVAAFLGAIDTVNKYTKEKGRAEYERMVTDLEMVVAKMQLARGEENADVEIPEILRAQLGKYLDFFETAANSEALGAVRLSAMSSEELKMVEDTLALISKAIEEDTDQRLAVDKGKISALAEKDIEKLEELGKKGLNSKMEDFFKFSNLQPVFYFKRLGEGASEIFRQIQKGWAQFAFHAQEIIDFAEKTYDGELAKNAEETVIELELYRRLPDDPENPEALRSEEKEKVKVTKAQIMSLYALSQRSSALTHLLGAGIRIGNIKQGGKSLTQAAKYLLSMDELNEITRTHLSDKERRVVEALVRFMSTTGSEWGNAVSMKRYGIKMFEEENYFPMKTDDTSRDARDPAADSTNLFRLASQGFTRALRPNAKNALVLDSVFDVFANHMVDMAKYNTLALPAIDAMRFWNYRTKTGENESGQVTSKELRTAVEEAYGSGAINYFTLFMKDLNGNREGGRGEDAFSKLTSRFKIASVGANMRVWLLQYSSIARAGAVLAPKIIAQNSGLNGKALKQAKEEMQRISGDARWKKLGFRDIAINANVRELIKQNQTRMDKLGEMSMKLAELADERVWAILWESCKQEVREKQGLTDDALLVATEERFQEVIYRTQVMDSTLTRSQLMRDKGNQYTQMITSFMSEPTLSYNMLLDAYNELQDESRKTSWSEAWQAKQGTVKRCLVTYVATSAAAAIFGSIANALRDDDEYESFAEKFLEAFKGNLVDELNPLAKIPVVRDIVSMAQGYGVERSDMTSIAQAYKALQIWEETIKIALGLQEEATDVTYKGRMTAWGKIFETLKAVSQLTGLPISSLTRDTVAIYNTLVGIRADMPIKTYNAGKASDIKWAYKDGYLSAEEAAAELLEEGIEDTEEDARWTVLGWDSGTGKYDAMEAALLAKDGEAYTAAVDELIAKGASKSGIESETKSIIKEAYQNKDKGEQLINKQEAIDLLVNQAGMRRKNAESLVQQWTSYVVDGIQYDDIDDAYIAGDISHGDAVEMRILYGGYTEAEAEETVLQWQCKKDTGIAYGDIKDEFIDGGISAEQALAMRMKYGRVDEEKAADTVLQWQCERDTGVPYENIQQFYDASEISGTEVVDMLMTYGGMEETDAMAKLAKFAFVDGNYSMNDITYAAVGKYNEFVMPSGMGPQSFYEVWKAMNQFKGEKDENGVTIRNSKKNMIVAYIDSLNISRTQKDALYRFNEWAESGLANVPWN